jgi:iron complex outermembrane receptor protein
LYGSGYYNKIYNYIYLAPTSENYFGFPIYRYLQHDAQLWGGEAILQIYPLGNKQFQIRNSAALTRGQLGNVGNLPFIPPVKWTSSLRFERQFGSKKIQWFAEPEMVWVGSQNNVAQFETTTRAYHLFNFYTGLSIPKNDSKVTISLSAQNALNAAYVDHLSRLKYYGILNPGRNFTLQVRFPIFTKSLNQN